MNINQVKYFVSVFELGSFSKAAKEQFVTVQAISKSINDLERETGLTFFERSSQGVFPTSIGKAFYQKAKTVLSAFEELEAFSEKDAIPETELPFRVALCAPKFNQYEEFCQALAIFVEHSLGFKIELSVINPDLAQEALDTKRVDALATIGTYEHKDVECVSVGTLPTGIIISPNHPLADKALIYKEDLKEFPVAMSPSLDGFNNSILINYRDNNMVGEIRHIESQDEIPRFLKEDKGYYFSAIVSQLKEPRPEALLKPIDPKDAIDIPICFVSLAKGRTIKHTMIENFLIQAVNLAKS